MVSELHQKPVSQSLPTALPTEPHSVADSSIKAVVMHKPAVQVSEIQDCLDGTLNQVDPIPLVERGRTLELPLS